MSLPSITLHLKIINNIFTSIQTLPLTHSPAPHTQATPYPDIQPLQCHNAHKSGSPHLGFFNQSAPYISQLNNRALLILISADLPLPLLSYYYFFSSQFIELCQIPPHPQITNQLIRNITVIRNILPKYITAEIVHR